MVKYSRFAMILRSILLSEFNSKSYWEKRMYLNNPYTKSFFLNVKRIFYYIYCKRVENFFNSSMGTNYHSGARFESIPNLPHGIKGIFISNDSIIGKNCTLLQHSTIGRSHGKSPIIGDNVIIGTGARIIGGVKVGDNSRIGANAVVVKDVKPNSTIVLGNIRVIIKDENYKIKL
jgi:serine O-acetyltransferase